MLVVSCVFPPESVTSASTSLDIANRLAQLGNEVTVLCPVSSRSVDTGWKYGIESSIHVVHLPSFAGNSSVLMKILENISFGVSAFLYLSFKKSFASCYMNSWPIFSTFLISTILRIKQTRYIYSVQDLYPQTLVIKRAIKANGFLFWILKKVEKSICDGSAQVVTISEKFKENITNTIAVDRQKISVIPNWSSQRVVIQEREVALSMLSSEGLTTKDCEVVFAYGGNISGSTGISDFCKFVLSSDLDVQLLVAGDGSLVSQISEFSHKDDRISLLTPWPRFLTNAIYSVSDVLVLPVPEGQEHGSLPSKLINYMETQKPILCICNSECEITSVLHKYPRALVLKWAELNSLKLSQLKALYTAKPSTSSKHVGSHSLEKLTKEILKISEMELSK